MWTSRTLRSRAILRPWQFLQRSRGLIRSPCPWHSWHIDCTCWMKPGSSCCMCTWVPVPLHPRHNSTAPSLPPRPINIHNLYVSSVSTRTYNTARSDHPILLHIKPTKHTSPKILLYSITSPQYSITQITKEKSHTTIINYYCIRHYTEKLPKVRKCQIFEVD